MKTNELRRKISGAALMFAMLLGITIAASATAQAQYRDYDDRYGRNDNQVRWSKDRERQYAYTLGYHNAYTEGREAADRGYRVDFRNSQAYRNSDNGYRPWMGDANTYRDNTRRGAEAGFKDGFSRRARRYDRQDVERLLGARMVDVYGESDDRDGGWRDRGDRGNGDWNDGNGRNDRNQAYRIAQENGYRDGLRHGQDDRNRNRRSNYQDSSDFRDASRGYRSEYGNRDAYRNAYREGFRRGYDEGYRNNRGNNRFPWPF
jgi:hypothetical protein